MEEIYYDGMYYFTIVDGKAHALLDDYVESPKGCRLDVHKSRKTKRWYYTYYGEKIDLYESIMNDGDTDNFYEHYDDQKLQYVIEHKEEFLLK